jgi:hypothetical protein
MESSFSIDIPTPSPDLRRAHDHGLTWASDKREDRVSFATFVWSVLADVLLVQLLLEAGEWRLSLCAQRHLSLRHIPCALRCPALCEPEVGV